MLIIFVIIVQIVPYHMILSKRKNFNYQNLFQKRENSSEKIREFYHLLFKNHRNLGFSIQTFFEAAFFYSSLPIVYYIWNGWNIVNNQNFNQKEKPHVGIIIMEYHKYFGKHFFYGCGIDILIRHFNQETPYCVYPCSTKEHVLKVISNQDVTSLWLIGHGDHGGISCTDDFFEYEKEIINLPQNFQKKDAIYQIHCNCGTGKSLVELLANGKGFVNTEEIQLIEYRILIEKLLNN